MEHIFNTGFESDAIAKRIQQFLQQHSLMVLSTINANNSPEAAVVEYFIDENCVLYFGTPRTSRKYRNITQVNSEVALVVGFYNEKTLQYQGKAALLENDTVSERIKSEVLSRLRKNYVIPHDEDYAYFCIQPRWIKFTDVAATPWQLVTLSFPYQPLL